MKPKSLLVLAALTLLVVLAASVAVRGRAPDAAAERGRMFPELTERANDVASIEIVKGDESLVLERVGGIWAVPALGGYPADFDRVREVVLALTDLEIVEPKTSRPDKYAKLEVEDPHGADAQSTLVTLRDGGGAEVVGAILGRIDYGRKGRTVYVRRAGGDQVFLCEGGPSAGTDPMSWVSKSILEIPATRIQFVRITHADGEVVAMSKALPLDANFTLAGVPVGRQLESESIANSVGSALAYLTLEGVKPAAEVDLDSEPRATSEYRTFDGLVVSLHLAEIEEETWLSADVRFEEPPTEVGPTPGGAEGEGDDASDALAEQAARNEAVRKEAEDLASRLSGWAYRVPAYKADVLARRMEDLLVEPPPEPAEPEPAGEAEEPAPPAEEGGA